jgi:transcriptional regulator with XRE-family HTH domain
MLSQTLKSGLSSYQIGSKIRSLRTAKGLGLAQLGEHCGLSPAMLSKIERGVLFPTLPTLLRIALVFGVGLDHFFSAREERPTVTVVRKKDRVRLPDAPGRTRPSYVFESLDFPVKDRRIETFLAEFPAQAPPTGLHRHGGAEVVYVIAGELAITVGDERTVLGPGDAMYFDSAVPHSYARQGRSACSAIVVVAPEGGGGAVAVTRSEARADPSLSTGRARSS